jgi:hypothetical protein
MMKKKNGIDRPSSAGRENNNHEREKEKRIARERENANVIETAIDRDPNVNETVIVLDPNGNGMATVLDPNANGMVIDLALSASVKMTAPEPTGNAEMALREKVFVLPVRDSDQTVPDLTDLGLRSVTWIRLLGASKETAQGDRSLLPMHVGTMICDEKWNNCDAK